MAITLGRRVVVLVVAVLMALMIALPTALPTALAAPGGNGKGFGQGRGGRNVAHPDGCSSPGPSSCPLFMNVVEQEFCEVRLASVRC